MMFQNWQNFLDETVKRYSQTPRFKEFCERRTLKEKVCLVRTENLINNTAWIAKYFEVIQNGSRSHQKSSSLADKHRQEGNVFFKQRKDEEALEAYNKCVMHAPAAGDGNTSHALGLGNRSAVLYHLRKFKESLSDIEEAMRIGYPSHLQQKLWLRKVQCLFNLKRFLEAKDALEPASKTISSLKDLNDQKRESLIKEIATWREKIASKLSSEIRPEKDTEDASASLPELTFGAGTVTQHASSGLELRHSDSVGRHFIANCQMRAGDTIIREKPYAAVLLPDHYNSHCHHCFGKVLVVTPCDRCCRVRFCCSQCKADAWCSYHWLECDYLDLLHAVGVAHLSLRVILVTGLEKILEFTEDLSSRQCSKPTAGGFLGVNSEGYYGCDYTAMYHLMPHHEDMTGTDIFQYTLTAVLLLECLKEGGFFHGKPRTTPTATGGAPMQSGAQDRHGNKVNDKEDGGKEVEREDLLGSLLLRHICQLICNAHAITELQVNEVVHVGATSLVQPQSQVRIATAIYLTTSLCNHACQPNIINSFHRDTLVVRAVEDISPGQEIFNCYGPQFRRMARAERRQLLKEQYFFDCFCRSCEQDEKVEQRHQALKCPDCDGALCPSQTKAVCLDCHRQVPNVVPLLKRVVDANDLFIEGVQLLDLPKITDAIVILEKCLRMRKQILYCHHRDLAETHDALARCYATKGDYRRSIEHLSESISTTEVIYGGKSIELANELHKFAEVLIQGREPWRAARTIQRALDIFLLHYGEGHATVVELRELQELVQRL